MSEKKKGSTPDVSEKRKSKGDTSPKLEENNQEVGTPKSKRSSKKNVEPDTATEEKKEDEENGEKKSKRSSKKNVEPESPPTEEKKDEDEENNDKKKKKKSEGEEKQQEQSNGTGDAENKSTTPEETKKKRKSKSTDLATDKVAPEDGPTSPSTQTKKVVCTIGVTDQGYYSGEWETDFGGVEVTFVRKYDPVYKAGDKIQANIAFLLDKPMKVKGLWVQLIGCVGVGKLDRDTKPNKVFLNQTSRLFGEEDGTPITAKGLLEYPIEFSGVNLTEDYLPSFVDKDEEVECYVLYYISAVVERSDGQEDGYYRLPFRLISNPPPKSGDKGKSKDSNANAAVPPKAGSKPVLLPEVSSTHLGIKTSFNTQMVNGNLNVNISSNKAEKSVTLKANLIRKLYHLRCKYPEEPVSEAVSKEVLEALEDKQIKSLGAGTIIGRIDQVIPLSIKSNPKFQAGKKFNSKYQIVLPDDKIPIGLLPTMDNAFFMVRNELEMVFVEDGSGKEEKSTVGVVNVVNQIKTPKDSTSARLTRIEMLPKKARIVRVDDASASQDGVDKRASIIPQGTSFGNK